MAATTAEGTSALAVAAAAAVIQIVHGVTVAVAGRVAVQPAVAVTIASERPAAARTANITAVASAKAVRGTARIAGRTVAAAAKITI